MRLDVGKAMVMVIGNWRKDMKSAVKKSPFLGFLLLFSASLWS
jgi:hypothetical protein